jgi:hypothetical protein
LHKGEQFTPELIWLLRMATRRDQTLPVGAGC